MTQRLTPLLTACGLAMLLCPGALAHEGFEFDNSDGGTAVRAASITGAASQCSDGLAEDFPCRNIHLQAFVAKADMGGNGNNLNDIWGWTDPATGAEIALVGRTNGTSFVDVSDPVNPVYLGFLPSHNNGSGSWRDIKVYADHAFIVADGGGNSAHGLQVFDLTQLRNAAAGTTFSETAHLGGFGPAHNIAINEDSGFAYAVGSDQCNGGLYMVDISTPDQPAFAGCHGADGYSHDAQCVTYAGPDTTYFGSEICVGYNEDSIVIIDVSDKNNPQRLSLINYSGVQYTHQGWFLDDNHSYLLVNDELDEARGGINTTTYLFDVSSLTAPQQTGAYTGVTEATDHNLYTRDGYVFESNYRAGLRIMDTANIATGELAEVAYFDTIACSNAPQFSGAWSSYIYFASGTIVTSDIGGGLFVLQPDWNAINDPNNPVDAPSGNAPDSVCGSESGGTGGGSAGNGGSSSGGGGSTGLWFIALLVCAGLGVLRQQRR